MKINEINRDMLTRRLQRHGWFVVRTMAQRALRWPQARCRILDVARVNGWPGSDPVDHQSGHTNPVIALDAHALASDRDKSVEVGCCDLIKPGDTQRPLGKLRPLPAIAAENVVA